MVTLITGGARSGKSHWAQEEAGRLAGESTGIGGGAEPMPALPRRPVVFIATATPDDDEMAHRIHRHRAERPEGWVTLECPLDPAPALASAAGAVVVLDCLTLLVSNLMHPPGGNGGGTPKDEESLLARVDEGIDRLLVALAARTAPTLVVTNEVGLGLVPANPLGRWYRDALGVTNRRVAHLAHRVVLLVSGIPVFVRNEPGGGQRGRHTDRHPGIPPAPR